MTDRNRGDRGLIYALCCTLPFACSLACRLPSTLAEPPAENITEVIRTARSAVLEIRVYDNDRVFSSGTGFLVDAQGSLLTNFHVVQGASRATAHHPLSGRAFDTELLVADPRFDLALLKIRARQGETLSDIGIIPVREDEPVEGTEVWAMGYPKSLGFTVTRGIVSGGC